MKDIQTLRLYGRVARLGSFSAAAREAGLNQSQVSRMVADLEASLAVRLLSRTTRAVVPTEAGHEFLARIEPILAALDDAQNSVRQTGELRGTLRVAAPSTMGMRIIIPLLPPFAERHPLLRIDLLLDDSWQNLVREAVDIGLRVGNLPDAAGTARTIGMMRRVVVAAPAYLERHGTPEHPNDLTTHRIVGGPAASQPSSWQFERAGERLGVSVQPHFTTNDTTGAIAAASASLGITSTTSWACRSELRSGALVRLFEDWEMAALPVRAYFPSGRASLIAARAFVDFIAEALVVAERGTESNLRSKL